MGRAAKNLLSGIGWFIFGCVMTSIDSESFYWGAMVVGAIQFIFGLTQIGDESEEELETEIQQAVEADLQDFSSELKWVDLDVTGQQRIIMEAVAELAYAYDNKLPNIDLYVMEDDEFDKTMQTNGYKTFKLLFNQIIKEDESDYSIWSRYRLGASERQYKYIRRSIENQDLQNNKSFGETLLKALYFYDFSMGRIVFKPQKLIKDVEIYFGFESSKIDSLKTQVQENISANAIANKLKEEISEAPDVARRALGDNKPVADDIASKMTQLNLEGTDFQDASLLKGFHNLTALYLHKSKIVNLDGFEHLKKLKWLYLGDCQVEDISALEDVQSLEQLSLRNTRVEDIRALANLRQLENLSLSGTLVKDISALSELKNLTQLDLDKVKCDDLSPLQNLIKLERLDISSTLAENMMPLQELLNLKRLKINYTKVSSLSSLRKLKNIKDLYLIGSKVEDLSPLCNLKNLSKLDIRDSPVDSLEPISKLETLVFIFAGGTALTGILPEFSSRSLLTLDISNTRVKDVSSLKNMRRLRRLYISNTQVSDVSFLAGSRSLKTLDLEGSKVTDMESFKI